MMRYPPGPKGSFLSGSLREFRGRQLEFLLECREQYGDVVLFHIGPRGVYMLNNPDDIHYVLVKHADRFNKSPLLKKSTEKSIGEGLLTSEGEFHRRQRRLVQPAFHQRRIETYASVMVDYTLRMVEGWQPGDRRDIGHEMMELTMRIVARTLFDADVSGESDAIGRAITLGIETVGQRFSQLLHLPEWIPTPKNRERQRAARLLDRTILKIIDERRVSEEDKGDLLSMLLVAVDEEDGGMMTNKQVRDEVMTLFIAGHETTANALTWTFYLLAQNPEVETKLVAELNRVLAGRSPTMHDLANLPYNLQVIKESMRLYPPAWIISRQAADDVQIGGYDIGAGSILVISPYVMHRDPRYWEEPQRFLPERFAVGSEERIPRFAYFPFGGGPRICIGNSFAMMEAQLLLATIVQRFSLALAPGQQIAPEPLVTLRPRGAIWMQLREQTREPGLAAPLLSRA